ncbi:hypothetical protein ANN_01069 [Periplaneta americana]|uniref:Uncharacterized protein n=1 Tax=Periplaneta americana TaxID=6978 RepID=A0ABQ8TSL6_PERAM|nr:hypothetical protein ANN_01069 [Periplaneta americana]
MRRDVDPVDWPPNSPDMNRFKICGLQSKGSYALIGQNNHPFVHLRNCEHRVLDAREKMAKNLALFHNLVDSMPRRMRADVDAGNNNILKIEDEKTFTSFIVSVFQRTRALGYCRADVINNGRQKRQDGSFPWKHCGLLFLEE